MYPVLVVDEEGVEAAEKGESSEDVACRKKKEKRNDN